MEYSICNIKLKSSKNCFIRFKIIFWITKQFFCPEGSTSRFFARWDQLGRDIVCSFLESLTRDSDHRTQAGPQTQRTCSNACWCSQTSTHLTEKLKLRPKCLSHRHMFQRHDQTHRCNRFGSEPWRFTRPLHTHANESNTNNAFWS